MKMTNMWKTGFFARFFVIFAVSIIFVSVAGFFQGDSAKAYSTLYSLGKQGISYITLCQLLFSSFMIASFNSIFLSEKLFGNMMMLTRVAWMLICIIITIIFCIFVFDWFPVDFVPGWLGFFLSFGICFTISTGVMVIKTRIESKKYGELLENYKSENKIEEMKHQNGE